MSKVNELRNQRAKAWEQTKAFLDSHRNEKGILSAEDTAAYERMEQEIVDLGHEIERQERADALERELAAPVSTPITAKPEAHKIDGKVGRASDAYKKAFWNPARARDGVSYEIRNSLSEGVDSEGGYLVPDEYERTLISALRETNAVFMGLVVLEMTANAVTREAAASGMIAVPVADSSAEDTTEVSVDVNLPVSWQEDGRAVVRARYVLNDTEIEMFYPTETYGSGKHTFPLYYPVANVIPNLLNNFSVYFSVSGGTALIGTGSCIATISGQGMAAEAEAEWDGTIVVEDTYTKWRLTEAVRFTHFTEAVSVVQQVPGPVGIEETVQKFRMTALPMVIE